jgi:hypothetical protein
MELIRSMANHEVTKATNTHEGIRRRREATLVDESERQS